MYTDDKNAQVVLSLLKAYGIKKIVISPGTTNIPISRSVQLDKWFEPYSVVDERGAAYFATGLAYESGEPVVISCTGATASRNYLSGLTEAYYRNIPIIALTSQHHMSDSGNLLPQVTDRSVSQNDVKKIAVHLPVVKDDEDYERCVISVNKALIAATTGGGGPVHINLPVNSYKFTTKELPDVRKIQHYSAEDVLAQSKDIATELKSKKVAIFVGSHRKFSKDEERALENFAKKTSAAVLVDHTSSYHGENSIAVTHISLLKQSSNLPDIVIDLGSISGGYSAYWVNGVQTWRISEDGNMHDRFHSQTKLLDCSESFFFETISGSIPVKHGTDYYSELRRELEDVSIPTELPLSGTLVAHELSKRIPKNSNLHLGILNSLRNMNFFLLDETINTSSNVGGFGIDGAISTLVGQSMVHRDKLTFGMIGDLAAFYDMNALGIRHIRNNIRILMVNNDGGVEFRLNEGIEKQWSSETNEFISARGHNGSMKAWAESMNFHYMSAHDKDEFTSQIKEFCQPGVDAFDKPVFFEVFTEIEDEQTGFNIMRAATPQTVDEADSPAAEEAGRPRFAQRVKSRVKRSAPSSVKHLYRKMRDK